MRDCSLPRRPWCSHYRNNTHGVEYYPDLISKWEDHFRHRGENMINSKHVGMAEIGGPNFNSITKGEKIQVRM